MAILCFHGGFGWAQGGFLGVSVFFTLSGFLITSLALVERERSGGVSPRAFWARRARRLLPASMLALLLATAVAAVVVPDAQQASVAGDIRAALLQVANWRFIVEGAPYIDLETVASPVRHYWSLAIEEQFYVLFPLLAAVTLRRRPAVLGGTFGVVVALSVLQQVRLDDVDRVYFGTDTRAAELAVGGLLALAWPRLRASAAMGRWPLADLGGLVALAGWLALVIWLPAERAAIYDGGLAAFSVLSALLVVGAVAGPVAARVIGTWPMVQLGKVSYGAYLYHFPLFLLLDEGRVGVDGLALFAVRVAVTVAIAAVSYVVVERPIRTGTALPTRLAPAALAAAAAVVLIAGLPVAARSDDERLVFDEVAPTTTAGPASSTTEVPLVTPSDGPGSTAGAPTTTAPPRPPRVVVVGDSTAAANGRGLEAWGRATGRLQVVTVSEPGCGVLEGERFKVREGYVFEPQRCDQLFPRAAAAVRDLDADAVVVFIGSSQLADWEYPGMEGLHHLGEPEVDARYGEALLHDVAVLEAAGRPILWASVALPHWDLEAFEEMIGSEVPGEGPVTLNDPPRTTRINQLDQAGVPRSNLASRWRFAERLMGPDGTVPLRIRPDGLHLSDAGVAEIADAWLFDELAAAYRAVVVRDPSSLAPAAVDDRHAWSPT